MILVKQSNRCKPELAKQRQGHAVPFFHHEAHHLYVMGTMNGAEGLYLLNSGMRGAELTAHELAYAHAGIGTPPLRQNAVPMVQVDDFQVGEHHGKELTAAFGFITQVSTNDGFRLDGMIGLGALAKGRLTLDFEQQKLYMQDPASDSKPADKRP